MCTIRSQKVMSYDAVDDGLALPSQIDATSSAKECDQSCGYRTTWKQFRGFRTPSWKPSHFSL